MKVTFYTVWILSLYVIQTNLTQAMRIFGIKPDFMLVFVILTGILFGMVDGFSAGLFAGIIIDILAGKVFGLNALMMMYSGILCGFLCHKFFKKSIIVAVTVTFFVSFAYNLLFYFFSFFIWGQTNIIFALTKVILPQCVYNMVISIPLFLVLRKFLIEVEI